MEDLNTTCRPDNNGDFELGFKVSVKVLNKCVGKTVHSFFMSECQTGIDIHFTDGTTVNLSIKSIFSEDLDDRIIIAKNIY